MFTFYGRQTRTSHASFLLVNIMFKSKNKLCVPSKCRLFATIACRTLDQVSNVKQKTQSVDVSLSAGRFILKIHNSGVLRKAK